MNANHHSNLAALGTGGKILVGGGIQEDEKVDKPPLEDNKEIVFFHEQPFAVDEVVCHSWPCCGQIDLTPGSGNRAVLAVKMKVPYIGFCFTQEHANALRKKVEGEVWAGMQKEGDLLFTAGLQELLQDVSEPSDDELDGQEQDEE